MTVMPRPSILAVEPYVGGESKIPGVNRIVKLSSNEGAFGPPPGAVEAIRAMATEAHRYPDGGAKALREAIGVGQWTDLVSVASEVAFGKVVTPDFSASVLATLATGASSRK